jgi:hypothetical protein
VLVIELRGTTTPFIFKGHRPRHDRQAGASQRRPGVYLSGTPHEVIFRQSTGQIQTERVRLAGNVLMWQQGPVTVRIEGTRTLRQALSIARSLR